MGLVRRDMSIGGRLLYGRSSRSPGQADPFEVMLFDQVGSYRGLARADSWMVLVS